MAIADGVNASELLHAAAHETWRRRSWRAHRNIYNGRSAGGWKREAARGDIAARELQEGAELEGNDMHMLELAAPSDVRAAAGEKERGEGDSRHCGKQRVK